MRTIPAAERSHSAFAGVESWHCFAAGAHYQPDNVGHGALLGCDEHLVQPGAGFDWHAHRGVDIVSWVGAGRLRHEDDGGRVRHAGPGTLLVQSAGSGIRHRETNASSVPLRLVQMTLLSDETTPAVRQSRAPLDLAAGRFEVWQRPGAAQAAAWHVFVAVGEWSCDGAALSVGDSARGAGRFVLSGSGTALIWLLAQADKQ